VNRRQKQLLVGAGATLGALWADVFLGLVRIGVRVIAGGGGQFGIEDVRFLGPRSSPDFSLFLPLAPLIAGLAAALFWGFRSRDAGKLSSESTASAEPSSPVTQWDGRSRFPSAEDAVGAEPRAARRPFDSPPRPDPLDILNDPAAPEAEKPSEKGAGKGLAMARAEAGGKGAAAARDSEKPRGVARPSNPEPAPRPASPPKPRSDKKAPEPSPSVKGPRDLKGAGG
jgi:hypothetical protein